MPDPRLERWAAVLVDYSVDIQPGKTVAIQGGVAAEPLLRELFRAVVERGAHPIIVPEFSGLGAGLLTRGNDDQIQYVSPVERFARESADVSIRVMADTNTKALSAVDPARQSLAQAARADLLQTFMRRAAERDLFWTLTLYPTDAYAQDADMATEAFADFIFAACKLNEPDPVAAWRAQGAENQRLIDWLTPKRGIRLRGRDTDLSLSIEGRSWINARGTRNFPDGEVFTGPVEDSVNGHVRFSYPVVTAGREIDDVRLRFEGGRVVDASAAKNEAYLLQTLDTDLGARVLGEFAFGTNFGITRFTKNILLDEKIGGTVHMAVGSGYPDTGSRNRSAIHWDLICDLRDGGEVDVDGEPFMRDGRFVI